jgi:hypothetical protein
VALVCSRVYPAARAEEDCSFSNLAEWTSTHFLQCDSKTGRFSRADRGAGLARPPAMAQDDGLEAVGRPKRPRFIPGIYNYCDRWCERCRFQARCRLFRDMQRMEQVVEGTLDRADLAALASDEEFEADMEEGRGPASPRERAEFLEFLQGADVVPPPEEMAGIHAACERRAKLQTAHPLSREAMEYAETAHRLAGVLRPMVRDVGDPLARESLETIARFGFLIAIKTRRAAGALIRASDDDHEDDEFQQSDGNGCAKLVRLVIGESREAWRLLMQLPSIAADGVPAAMAARLDDLDAHLAAAFPHAMAFVRAGFDEG